jgi:hypothetical protein
VRYARYERFGFGELRKQFDNQKFPNKLEVGNVDEGSKTFEIQIFIDTIGKE